MPNQRRAGQTFIGAQLDEDLLASMDLARGFKDRSQFVREAIAEKLRKMAITVPEHLIHAPRRTRMIQKIGDIDQSISLNETLDPSPAMPIKEVSYSMPKKRDSSKRKPKK